MNDLATTLILKLDTVASICPQTRWGIAGFRELSGGCNGPSKEELGGRVGGNASRLHVGVAIVGGKITVRPAVVAGVTGGGEERVVVSRPSTISCLGRPSTRRVLILKPAPPHPFLPKPRTQSATRLVDFVLASVICSLFILAHC